MPSPSEVARWMREEHRCVEELIAHLGERVADPPRVNIDGWLKELRDDFERFRAHLLKHFALEEEGGYLNAVREVQPALDKDIQGLMSQHREVGHLLTDVFHEVSQVQADMPLRIRDACCRIRNLIEILQQHEDIENRLVSQVLTRDVGTHD
jgi:iron-sulfur cluster repair protein YtfE (RIC family)